MELETFRVELESVTIGDVKIDARGWLTSYQERLPLYPNGPGIIPGRWEHSIYLRIDNQYCNLFKSNLDSLIVITIHGQQYKLNSLNEVNKDYWQLPLFCEKEYQYLSREKL